MKQTENSTHHFFASVGQGLRLFFIGIGYFIGHTVKFLWFLIQKSLRFFFYLWAFALATALTLALIFFLVSQGVHLLDDTNIMRTALEKSDPLINILWQKTMNTMFSIPPQ